MTNSENELDEQTVIVDEIYLTTMRVENSTLKTKLQLAQSAIRTVIHELEEEQTGEQDWLIEYLYGVLENLK